MIGQLGGLFEPLDRRLLDAYFLVRGEREPRSPIVIVAVDYESLLGLDHRWPWPRSIHASLLRRLREAGAAVVAFDVLFLDPNPGEDDVLAQAAAGGNVVWASTFMTVDQQGFSLVQHRPPLPTLREASPAFGYVNLLLDSDGSVRRVSPFRSSGDQLYRSFAVTVADRFRRRPMVQMTSDGLRAPADGNQRIPVEPDGSLLINFAAPPSSFPTVPYLRVLQGTIDPAVFAGRVVLVGAAIETGDAFFTPFYSGLLPETRKLMPGVEVHANIIDMILRAHYLGRARPAWVVGLWLGLGVGAAALIGWRRAWWSLWALLVTLGLVVVGAYLCFVALHVWLPAAGLLLSAPALWGAVVFHGLVAEGKDKRFIRSVLDVYVAPEVIEDIVARRVDLALGGTRRTLTVLFSDVRDFTGLSERIAPETMVEMLGEHFAAMSEIVLRHRGTLDKFIGDAVMAFWGAPDSGPDDALRAVQAAIEMQAATTPLAATVRERLGERFAIGIGINTGDAVVGHIGSRRRMAYTAVGDPVNLAARVEGLTRRHDTPILITQFTYERVRYDVDATPLGFETVKGRQEPVAIYRVNGLRSSPGLKDPAPG